MSLASDQLRPERPPSSGVALGLLCFLLVLAPASLQTDLLVSRIQLLDVARLLATGFILGFLPAFALANAARLLRERTPPTWLGRPVFWLPPLLSLAYGAALALDGPQLKLDAVNLALLVACATLLLVGRRLHRAPNPLPYHLAPAGLVWLGMTAGFVALLEAPDGELPAQLRVFPALVAVGSVILCAASDALDRRWRSMPDTPRKRLLRWAALAAFVAPALAVFYVMEHSFAGLYLSIKNWLTLSSVLAGWLLFEPVLRQRSRGSAGRLALLATLPLAGLAASIWLLLSPVPERFGAHPPRTLVGAAASLVSLPADLDGDGFYAESSGGNDCDDDSAARTPIAFDPELNCWAGDLDADPRNSTRRAQERAAHALVVIVDALRADEFGARERSRYPNLDRLYDRSQVFSHAYAPGNSTFQSVAPMLSGVHPLVFLESFFLDRPVPPGELVTPRSLFARAPDEMCLALITQTQEAGDWFFPYREERFDVTIFDAEPAPSGHSSPDAHENVARALDTCEGRRTLMVLYLNDPHRDQHRGGYTCRDGRAGGRECYREEIEVVDDALGAIFEQFERREMLEETAVVLTSDHGEAFGEHGYGTHASSVHEEQVRVPLLVSLPGVEGAEIDTPVSLLSSSATVTDVLGAPTHGDGPYPSLLPLIADPTAPYPAPVAENWLGHFKPVWASPTSAMASGDWKLIYGWKSNSVQLYNLEQDPHEHDNLASSHAARTARLLERFRKKQAAMLTGN